jgi:AcrR family transcriptional regulator
MERRADELRLEIARAAMDLFVADGDTSATVERIAEAAGVATRTFYRHFAVKEDAIVPLFRRSSGRIAAALRDADDDEDLVEVLIRTFRRQLDADRMTPKQRAFLGLMMTNPQYRMRWIEVDGELREAVADLLAARLDVAGDHFAHHLAAELLAHAARRAFEEWLTAGSDATETVDELLRKGFELVLGGVVARTSRN